HRIALRAAVELDGGDVSHCYQYPKGRPNYVSIQRNLLGEAFEPAPDALQESRGGDAIEHPVVEAQAEIHHRSDGDRISVHYHRLDDDRYEGHVDPLFLLAAVSSLLTEAHHVAHVDLGSRPGMRDRLLAPDHATGDGASHGAEWDGSTGDRRRASGSWRSIR